MGIFSKTELSANEQEIANVISDLCNSKGTIVVMNTSESSGHVFKIVNETLHYKILIDNSGVIISNTDFSRRGHFSSKVLSAFKEIAKEKFDNDWQHDVDSITLAESSIIKRMREALAKSSNAA